MTVPLVEWGAPGPSLPMTLARSQTNMKLYYSENLNPRVAVAVARHLSSPVEFVRAMPRHPAHEEAFRPINPNTLVPVLVEEGQTLWETDAIACRLAQLARSSFWRTDERLPQMMMWVSWSTQHFTLPASSHYFERCIRPTFSDVPEDPKVLAKDMVTFKKYAAILDQALKTRRWLVDDQLSYADFRTATVLPFAQRAGLPIAEYPNIVRWYAQLEALDAWREPFAGLPR
jgi:glutathione S-transferase